MLFSLVACAIYTSCFIKQVRYSQRKDDDNVHLSAVASSVSAAELSLGGEPCELKVVGDLRVMAVIKGYISVGLVSTCLTAPCIH